MFGLFKRKTQPPALPPLRRDQLIPRIKHLDFVRTLERAGVPPGQRPAVTALCGELVVTHAFDLPDSFIMATPSLVEEAGIGLDRMARLAVVNLERDLPEPQFFERRGCGVAHVGKDMEAALLLVDTVWDELGAGMRGELVVSTPRRDRLLVCDSADPDALTALREQSREFFNEHADPHALSTQLMARRRGAWVLFEQ